MPRPVVHAHKLVVQTAVQMAHELYDVMMQDNQWWATWLAQNPGASRKAMEKRFVRRNLPLLVPQARAALARCLHPGQSSSLTEPDKSRILEALVLDNQLVRGRAVPALQLN